MRFLFTLNVRRAPNISGSFSWDGDVSCREKQKEAFFCITGYDRLQLDNYFTWSFCSLASAHNPTSTLIILDITKASSNNCLESTNCVHVFTEIIFIIHQVF